MIKTRGDVLVFGLEKINCEPNEQIVDTEVYFGTISRTFTQANVFSSDKVLQGIIKDFVLIRKVIDEPSVLIRVTDSFQEVSDLTVNKNFNFIKEELKKPNENLNTKPT